MLPLYPLKERNEKARREERSDTSNERKRERERERNETLTSSRLSVPHFDIEL